MAYRFEKADDAPEGRIQISNAAGSYVVGTAAPAEDQPVVNAATGERLEDPDPVDVIEVVTADEAAVLRAEAYLKDVTDYTVESPQPDAPLDRIGKVPESTAELHPDAVRNTDPDDIVPDELYYGTPPDAVDASSPATVDAGDPGEPAPPQRTGRAPQTPGVAPTDESYTPGGDGA